MSLLKKHPNKDTERRVELYRKMIRHEARIGGTLFGPVPVDRDREFFCLDTYTWVWHEEWTNEKGQREYVTTRYDVRPGGIMKSQNGKYLEMPEQEVRTLIKAIRLYEQRMKTDLYSAAL